jgi:outer membrane protein insertion porin family
MISSARALLAAAAVTVLVCSIEPLGWAQTKTKKKPAAAPPAPLVERTKYPLENLKIQGNHIYSAEQIMVVAALKPGQEVAVADFETARQRLLATGAFDRAGFTYAPSSDAEGYDATLDVTEMPQVYSMRFEDLPASDAELREFLRGKDPLFGPRIPGTQLEIDRYSQWISEFLTTKNYHAPVAGHLTQEFAPDLTILFRPAAPRPNIAQVRFLNTGDLAASAISMQMQSVAVGVAYTETGYRQLLDNSVRPMYEKLGRIKVSFLKIETEKDKQVEGVIVTTQIDQGPQYKLAKVAFTGARSPGQSYERLAKLKGGELFNLDAIKAAQERIEQSFHRSGFLDVKSQIKRDFHDADKTVDVTFQIDPGREYHFGKLTIQGLDIITEPVIRKMWGLEEGKPFNVEYPDHFLGRVREDGVFDNLKSTRSESKVNKEQAIVDVTLHFNEPGGKLPEEKAPRETIRKRPGSNVVTGK